MPIATRVPMRQPRRMAAPMAWRMALARAMRPALLLRRPVIGPYPFMMRCSAEGLRGSVSSRAGGALSWIRSGRVVGPRTARRTLQPIGDGEPVRAPGRSFDEDGIGPGAVGGPQR